MKPGGRQSAYLDFRKMMYAKLIKARFGFDNPKKDWNKVPMEENKKINKEISEAWRKWGNKDAPKLWKKPLKVGRKRGRRKKKC